ncbi:MAG TPA: hypothetical protein VND21_03310 [Planctomycetota bacterium]|jgi:hypothetical protein|nr:hypothetical protein [Planctomycetota bacterium]
MKWMSIYLIGYLLFMGAVFLALSHLGILDDMGPTWTLISVLFALGVGIMIAVANSGRKDNIEIDSH